MKIAHVLLLSGISSMALAQAPEKTQPTLSDFAMQIPLRLTGDNGVVQIRLPLVVYQYAQCDNLADVRVFNAAGKPVPFAFFKPARTATVRWREGNAAIFPITGDTAEPGQIELDVRASRDGALLSVHAKSAASITNDSLSALVLDLGKRDPHEILESLQFLLPEKQTATYRAQLAIEQSDDLKLWTRVAQSRVDWLRGVGSVNDRSQSPSQSLINDRIELSPGIGRYVRIQWLEGTPLQFARVVTRWRSSENPEDEAMEVVLKPTPGKMAGDWVYNTTPAIAATELGVNLPNANTVMPVTIGFYRQQSNPRQWVLDPMIHTTFYRITQNSVERASSRLRIAPQSASEWVIRPQRSDDDDAPNLVLRWRPQTIAFTAQGGRTSKENASFILAFGAAPKTTSQWLTSETSLDLVAPNFSPKDLNNLEQAILGEARATSAAAFTSTQSAKASETKDKKHNRTWVLWTVLVFGALILLGMSLQLYKQMNKDPS